MEKIAFFISTAFLAMTVVSFTAHADDAKGYVYSPEGCEFSVTFPAEPFIKNICEDDEKKRCYDEVSFTQTYDTPATVEFRVICNPIDEEVYKHYSPEIMEATLKAMTARTVVKTYDTSFREEKGYKQAGLVGEGKMGRSSTIYIAQLWIASKSALSIEADMTGEANDAADKLFSEVLKSTQFKDSAGEAKPDEAKPENKSEEGEKQAKP